MQNIEPLQEAPEIFLYRTLSFGFQPFPTYLSRSLSFAQSRAVRLFINVWESIELYLVCRESNLHMPVFKTSTNRFTTLPKPSKSLSSCPWIPIHWIINSPAECPRLLVSRCWLSSWSYRKEPDRVPRLDDRWSRALNFSPASFLTRWSISGKVGKTHTDVGYLWINHVASQSCVSCKTTASAALEKASDLELFGPISCCGLCKWTAHSCFGPMPTA